MPKKWLICSKVKFIRGTRTGEKLILCNDLCADQILKMASKWKTDEMIIAACWDELIAKEVYYHKTCYQSFTRDFISSQNAEKQTTSSPEQFLKNSLRFPLIAKRCAGDENSRSSLLIRKSFLTNALSKSSLYPSLFQLFIASILLNIFLLCLCIVRKPVVFDFITCPSFRTKIIEE